MKEERKALILGSTGLTGQALADLLATKDTYSEVILPVRRTRGRKDPGIREVEIDYNDMKAHEELFAVDDIFCCLGTTMKKAGSREAFRQVDYDYPLNAAALGKEKGASRFFIITALGSDPDSKIFYNRVKGEVEKDLQKLSFEALHIFRPSLLMGPREEMRLKEKAGIVLFKILSFVFVGPLKMYRAIEGETVARAMAAAADTADRGVIVHPSHEMQQWAD